MPQPTDKNKGVDQPKPAQQITQPTSAEPDVLAKEQPSAYTLNVPGNVRGVVQKPVSSTIGTGSGTRYHLGAELGTATGNLAQVMNQMVYGGAFAVEFRSSSTIRGVIDLGYTRFSGRFSDYPDSKGNTSGPNSMAVYHYWDMNQFTLQAD